MKAEDEQLIRELALSLLTQRPAGEGSPPEIVITYRKHEDYAYSGPGRSGKGRSIRASGWRKFGCWLGANIGVYYDTPLCDH